MQQSTGLYVGNLDESVTTDQLYTFFYKFEIINIHHPYDQVNKRHKNFAFVYFQTPEQANKARMEKNHEKIMFKAVRLMQIINLNELKTEANVYIKNLDPNVTPQEFEVFFQQFGQIVTSTLRCKDDGESLCYGYVQYANKQMADFAISKSGTPLKDRNVQIEPFKTKKNRKTFNKQTNLYIKNLPDLNDDLETKVKKEFGNFGEITSMCLKLDTNIQKTFGFINFSNHDEAKAAYQQLNDTDVFDSGTNLYINWAQSKYERTKAMRLKYKNQRNETKLYIRSLKPETTKEDLVKVFSQFGNVTYSSIRDHKKDDQLMKFGFVEFENKEEANKAMQQALENEDVLGISLSKPAFIKFAQSKEIRLKYLKIQRQKRKKAESQKMMYGQSNRQMNGFNMNSPQAQMLFLMMQQLSGGNMGSMMKMMDGSSQNQNRNRGNYQRYNNNRGRRSNYNQNRNNYFNQRRNFAQMNQQPMMASSQMMTPQMNQSSYQMMQQMQSPQNQKPSIQQLLGKWDLFLNMERNQQRNIMGEVIYPFVMKINQQYAPKITGMLIDLDFDELKSCLMKESHMIKKIKEAAQMLSHQDQLSSQNNSQLQETKVQA